MSKRPSSSHPGSLDETLYPPSKRLQTEDQREDQLSEAQLSALQHLSQNADGIIAALQRLKKWQNTLKEGKRDDAGLLACGQDLAELNRQIAPHLQSLSEKNCARGSLNASSTFLSALQAPSMGYVTAWNLSEIAQKLPPLPAVKDKKLEELAFTHPGYVYDSHPDRQYERLEWLGDAYLELIATALIDKTFVHLPSGRCSQIRERLIRNTTLAAYFREYGLESRARLPSDFMNARRPGRGSSSDKDLLKTQGDMFEAYTAAIIVSDPEHGIQTAVDWLKALWGREVYEDVKKLEQNRPAAAGHKSKRSAKEELSTRIVVKGITIRYEKVNSNKRDKHLGQELFSVAAYLDGWGERNKFLGAGSALSVKEAGQKAAEEALMNKKMLKIYEGKKKAFLEAREAAGQPPVAE